MQFQEIIRIYSIDVILIAGLVCAITALIRKCRPAFYEKAGQYFPFVSAVAFYLLYDMALNHFDALEQAISKGLQCAVCAVLLKTAFEEWICKEKKVSLPKDRALLAAMGVLSSVTDWAHAKELALKFTVALEQARKQRLESELGELCLLALEEVLPSVSDGKLIELASALAGTLRALDDGVAKQRSEKIE